jgi:hypothetical protein
MVCQISTHNNPADMLMKLVPPAKFKLCSGLVDNKVRVLVTFGISDYLLLS